MLAGVVGGAFARVVAIGVVAVVVPVATVVGRSISVSLDLAGARGYPVVLGPGRATGPGSRRARRPARIQISSGAAAPRAGPASTLEWGPSAEQFGSSLGSGDDNRSLASKWRTQQRRWPAAACSPILPLET